MSKIKFGNFITYRGGNLATPRAKAVKGNLVFAEITEGADKGYYIFGGVAEGHLVTYDVFNATKKELKELIGAGELEMPKHDDGTYYSIIEYVNERLEAYKVKDVKVGSTSIVVDGVVTLGDAAQRNVATEIALGNTGLVTSDQVQSAINSALTGENVQIEGYNVKDITIAGVTTTKSKDGVVDLGAAAGYGVATAIATGASGLATAGQVADAISGIKLGATALSSYEATGVIGETGSDNKLATEKAVRDAISTLGTVMEFKGVVTGDDLPDTANFSKGDVIIWNGEEYVLDEDGVWCEIGQVKADEAVLSLAVNQGSTDYITLNGVSGLNGQYSGYVTAGLNVVESDLMETEGDDLNQLVSAAAVKEAISNIPAATVTGAAGYLTVDKDKNVVVDAAQVQFGATDTSTMLATKGYVEGVAEQLGIDIEAAKTEAAKHSSVTSTTETYIGVTGVTTENGVEYQVSLKAEALKAENHSISEIKIDGESATTADTVQAALQNLFEGDKTAAKALDDLDKRLVAHIGATTGAHAASAISYEGTEGSTATDVEAALDELYAKVASAALSGDAANIDYKPADGVVVPEGVDKVNEALDDLYTQLAALDSAAVKGVTGDTASYSEVVPSEEDEQVKIVKNVLADNVVGEDGNTTRVHGLVTDEYLDEALAWEDITE